MTVSSRYGLHLHTNIKRGVGNDSQLEVSTEELFKAFTVGTPAHQASESFLSPGPLQEWCCPTVASSETLKKSLDVAASAATDAHVLDGGEKQLVTVMPSLG